MNRQLRDCIERQLREAPVEWHLTRIFEPEPNLRDGYRPPRLCVEWYDQSSDLDEGTVLSIATTIAAGLGEVGRVEPLGGAAEGGYQYVIEVAED